MNNITYIVEAKRTPISKYGGSLLHISAVDLASQLIKKMLFSMKVKRDINQVIMGNVLSAGLGQNPARMISISSGIPESTPAYTVNMVCGSGLKSVLLGAQTIGYDEADLIIAGGVENMSRVPYYLHNYRFGVGFGNQQIVDGILSDALSCSLIGEHMGMTAEHIVEKFNISRNDQDKFALSSHQKAIAATDRGIFKEEIVAVDVKIKGKMIKIDTDETLRRDSTYEKLSNLAPVFTREGMVTAGNSSPLSDGAAAVIIASKKYIHTNKIKPLAKIISWAEIGLDPKYMGLGAYYAAELCLKKASIKKSKIDLWEINEAFAAQALAVIRLLKIDEHKVNVNGGAISLGHPIGASGARILVTLLYELKRRKLRYGLASLCIGGGQGIAMIIETL